MRGRNPNFPGVHNPGGAPHNRRSIDDEFYFMLASATADASKWLATIAGTPGSNNADIKDDARGGVVIIETGTTTGNTNQYQINGSFAQPADRTILHVYTELALVDIDKSNFAVGLIVETDTEVLGGSNQDGVYFYTESANGIIRGHVGNGSGESEASTGVTVADSEYVELSLYVFERTRVEFYVNGALKYTAPVTYLPTNHLTLFFQITTANDASEQLLVDYISFNDWDK